MLRVARNVRRCAVHAALLRDADVLRLGEETQRLVATFPADTALLHPAERHPQIAHHPAIDPDRAGVDPLCDAMHAAEVLRPDARREAVIVVVRVADNFIFAYRTA